MSEEFSYFLELPITSENLSELREFRDPIIETKMSTTLVVFLRKIASKIGHKAKKVRVTGYLYGTMNTTETQMWVRLSSISARTDFIIPGFTLPASGVGITLIRLA